MILCIKVKPGSKKQEIIKINEKEYIVHLKKRAENNEANIELLNLLKKYFKRDLKIIKGLKSRDKILEIK